MATATLDIDLAVFEGARGFGDGGGIARNLPHLAGILGDATNRRVDGATDLDESLLGLRALALRCAGRAPRVSEAWCLHRRSCEVVDD